MVCNQLVPSHVSLRQYLYNLRRMPCVPDVMYLLMKTVTDGMYVFVSPRRKKRYQHVVTDQWNETIANVTCHFQRNTPPAPPYATLHPIPTVTGWASILIRKKLVSKNRIFAIIFTIWKTQIWITKWISSPTTFVGKRIALRTKIDPILNGHCCECVHDIMLVSCTIQTTKTKLAIISLTPLFIFIVSYILQQLDIVCD